LVIVPGVPGAVITIVSVALAPAASVPKLQVRVDVPEQLPALGVTDTTEPEGSVSTTVTLEAEEVPLFVTETV
jgi:hypothetical protein